MKTFYFLFFLIAIFSCTETIENDGNKNDRNFYLKNLKPNLEVYSQLKDTFKIWTLNKLPDVEAENIYEYEIDSLLCFNQKKNRLITCRHLYVNTNDASSDDLQFIYGEKIDSNWYFFKGPSIVIPREMVKGHPINKPLHYQQLHEIALKEVFGGYLNNKGEINEKWFIGHFEGPGWGDFNEQSSSLRFLGIKEKFTDKRKFFETLHLQSTRNNWASVNPDSIKTLPPKNSP